MKPHGEAADPNACVPMGNLPCLNCHTDRMKDLKPGRKKCLFCHGGEQVRKELLADATLDVKHFQPSPETIRKAIKIQIPKDAAMQFHCYECHNPEVFARVCPGKERWIGQQTFFRAMEYVARRLPRGAVSGEVIAGLEPIEDTLFRLGSPRCLECRQSTRPLDPDLAGVALNGHLRNGGATPLGLRLRPTEGPSSPT